MKQLVTRRTAVAVAAEGAATVLEAPETPSSEASASLCPACGARAYASVLSADTGSGGRALVSCARCGLLRFLGEAPKPTGSRFADFLWARPARVTFAGWLLDRVRRSALQGSVRFVLSSRGGTQGRAPVLVADAGDGSLCRELKSRQADCLLVSPDLAYAERSLHREGVDTLVGDAAEAPVRPGTIALFWRPSGFSAETDPAQGLIHAARRLRAGGRVILQVFDCSSWGFLVGGSHWVGLEAESASFAYRGEDLEVLLELCGMRVVRRSHYFPLLNALVWASSLFPSVDVARGRGATGPSSVRIALYLLAVLALLPLAFLESLCHAGSVLMIEAERRT